MRDMQAEGIRFILGRGIKEIASSGLWGRLFGRSGKGVILEDGERLKAEVVIVATGTRPNVDLIRGTGMTVNRGIPVNDYMETSIADIYAAGDVAETKDVVTGKVGLTPIWPNAAAQGRISAYNMAGCRRPYGGMVGMQNAVEFREIPAIAMGLTQPEGNNYEVLADYQPDRNYYKKLVLRDNILVGMILVGAIHQAGVYGALIKKRAEISPYRHRLMREDFSYAHIFSRLVY
ncbi:Nitrite reductase [Neomoorella glycerini]|uniref:Nitrite reductase n=1 Tax=Neomoorella glycerini TaxID=55779 RepID=A0A6I5ZMA7_9FIRM|nr:FAD-dependent oxidoreductase [Moorella glycerini]QGP91002.1 Nitrite reductase [Moorella glycerini]